MPNFKDKIDEIKEKEQVDIKYDNKGFTVESKLVIEDEKRIKSKLKELIQKALSLIATRKL